MTRAPNSGARARTDRMTSLTPHQPIGRHPELHCARERPQSPGRPRAEVAEGPTKERDARPRIYARSKSEADVSNGLRGRFPAHVRKRETHNESLSPCPTDRENKADAQRFMTRSAIRKAERDRKEGNQAEGPAHDGSVRCECRCAPSARAPFADAPGSRPRNS